MIQINPLQSYIDGGARAAITTPPSASLVFDLPGKAIWVKGVKLKGTDHAYTFSHDNYISITNTPDQNNPESEDIKIGINTTLLKLAIDTTYGIVNATTNGLAPMFSNANKASATAATTYNFLGIAGSTLKWYQLPWRNVRINAETSDVLGINNTDPLIISSGNGIEVSWDSTNKKIVITNTKPDINHNTDTHVSQLAASDNADRPVILKQSATTENEVGSVRYTSTLLYNPSTKILKINGNRVVTFADTYVGATSSADATTGLVPAASSANRNKFLRGDGTWQVPTNDNTWRPVKVEGTQKLASTTDTDALDFHGDTGIEITYDATNKKINIKNTAPDVNHNTHYTTTMYVGENNDTAANKAVNSNPYLKLFDDAARRSTLRFVAGTGITIKSDASGNITITNASPDVNHNTDRTGIKKSTVSGTKKTDATLIIANSSSGLIFEGGTNLFKIGDGTNYVEIPVNPSFTVTDKSASILSSLTTLATIAGTDIKAKVVVDNKAATIGTTATTIATVAGVDITAKIGSYAAFDHTHPLSIAIDSGTSSIALAASTKYKLTAGGSTYIFTSTPDLNVQQVDNNNNENVPILLKNGTGTGTITSSVRTVDGVTINPSANSLSVGGNLNVGGRASFGSSVQSNYITFHGLTSDGRDSYDAGHTYIGNRLYQGTSTTSTEHVNDFAELVLFQGNDPGGGNALSPVATGPDRIRHIAAAHLFQVYTSALSGTFEAVCGNANLVSVFAINSNHVVTPFFYKSTIATGTAPIQVTSTTVCSNLNADMVDGKHAGDFALSSHNHNMNDIKWPGSHNLVTSATANNQEWSIDLTPGTYTGTYWQVWRKATSGISTTGTLLRVDSDTGKVSAPYGFVGNVTGNLSGTATNADTVDGFHSSSFVFQYPLPVKDGGQKYWHRIGNYSNANNTALVITCYAGDGWNSSASQNEIIQIFLKKGYQSSPSATNSIGCQVFRYNWNRFGVNGVDVVIVATSDTAGSVWLYQNAGYVSGRYTISGNWTWEHNNSSSDDTQTTPTSNNSGVGIKLMASTSDNVASATKLQTARTIWGLSFDGTDNVDGKLTISSDPYTTGTANSLLNILINGRHDYGVAMKIHSYGGDAPCLRFSHSNSADDLNSQVNDNWSVGMQQSSYNNFAITQNRGTTGWGNIRLLIDNSGNVGIGTTSPSYKLHVAGSLNATAIYQNEVALGARAFDNTDYLPLTGGRMIGDIHRDIKSLERGVAPSNNIYAAYDFLDKNKKRLAQLEYASESNGKNYLHLYVLTNTNSSVADEYGGLRIYKSQGVSGNVNMYYNVNTGVLSGLNSLLFDNNAIKAGIYVTANNIDLGWNYDNRHGAMIYLRGSTSSDSGSFGIVARNSNASVPLVGKIDGTLTWDGKTIYHAGNVNGLYNSFVTNVNAANQNVDYIRIATISLSSSGLASGGFTAIMSPEQFPEKRSHLLRCFVRRESSGSVSYELIVTPFGTELPPSAYIRTSDNITFYVYIKKVPNAWRDYYAISPLWSRNTTFERVASSSMTGSSGIDSSLGGMAAKLATARTLWGQSFDGTGNVSGNMTINGNKEQITLNPTSGTYSCISYVKVSDDGYNWSVGITKDAYYLWNSKKSATVFDVTNDGNVGIGTTSPSYKLSVSGDVSATNFRGNLVGNADSATKLKTARTIWGQNFDGTANVSGHLSSVSGIKINSTGSSHGYIDFHYASAQKLTSNIYERQSGQLDINELLYVTRNGNVGIGTTSPSYKLHVSGDVGASNFYTTSDRSKKHNISSFSEHIRKFQLKDTEKWHYGVIAQEVPEMFRDGEEGNMTVNYNSVLSFYIGLLENRVKMLEERIRILESK